MHAVVFTSCICVSSSVFSQVALCWTLPFMVHLVTLIQWSTRSVTVLGFTTCFEVYQRSSHVTMHVWRLNPQWRLGICAKTPTPLPNTKAATILNRATKPVAVGISHTRRLTTTWVMQVRCDLPGQNVTVIPLTCKSWHTEITIEEFVESVCILRQVWNLAGTFHGKNKAGGTSFNVAPFVQKFNIFVIAKWKHIQIGGFIYLSNVDLWNDLILPFPVID